jgi:hypothetical protein
VPVLAPCSCDRNDWDRAVLEGGRDWAEVWQNDNGIRPLNPGMAIAVIGPRQIGRGDIGNSRFTKSDGPGPRRAQPLDQIGVRRANWSDEMGLGHGE